MTTIVDEIISLKESEERLVSFFDTSYSKYFTVKFEYRDPKRKGQYRLMECKISKKYVDETTLRYNMKEKRLIIVVDKGLRRQGLPVDKCLRAVNLDGLVFTRYEGKRSIVKGREHLIDA